MQTRKIIGYGNPKKIAIAMTSHGIGDDISAMPAIAQKISEGYDITVFCKSFSQKIWRSLGCKVYPSVNPLDEDNEHYYRFESFVGENFEGYRETFDLKNEFGIIYELPQWSIEKTEKGHAFHSDRIKYFASLIDTTPMKNFSWIEVLKPQRINSEPYVLFAPDSASKNRILLRQKKLYRELKKNSKVVMFGQSSLYHFHKEVKPMPRHNKKDRVRVGVKKATRFIRQQYILFKNREIDKRKILAKSFDEFLAYIYSAKVVIGADSGTMNTARALGVPCIAVFGTTPEIAASQYNNFNDSYFVVVKCEYSNNGVDIEDKFNHILEKSKWQKQQIRG